MKILSNKYVYLSDVFIFSPNAGDLIEIEMKMIDL